MDETAALPLGLTLAQLAPWFEHHGLGSINTVSPLGDHTLLINTQQVLHVQNLPHLLPKLALIYRRLRAADLPAPEVVLLDTARTGLPVDALVVQAVPGVNAATVVPTLPLITQEALAEALGRLVGQIHLLPCLGYGDYAPSQQTIGPHGRWTGAVVERTLRTVRTLEGTKALPLRLIDGAVTALNDGDSLLETASPPTLTHAQIDWRNVILESTANGWEIRALLGWSHAFIADVAWEFATLWLRREQRYPDPDYFLSGYKELRKPQSDRRPRMLLYRLLLHMEGAAQAYHQANASQRSWHEAALTRLLRAS